MLLGVHLVEEHPRYLEKLVLVGTSISLLRTRLFNALTSKSFFFIAAEFVDALFLKVDVDKGGDIARVLFS